MKSPKDFTQILTRIQDAENWRESQFRDRWENCLLLYRSKVKEKREGSNIFVPQVFMQCEVVKSRVAGSIFANRPYVSMFARKESDVEKAKAAQTLIDWQFNERMDLPGVFIEGILHDAITLGTAISYTGWQKRERITKTKEKIDIPVLDAGGIPYLSEDGVPATVSTTIEVESVEVTYDDPIVQRVDPFDFFVDRQATKIADARFCGHVEYLTREAIENLEATAGWKVEWKNLSPESDLTGGKEIRSEIDTGGGIGSVDDNYTKEEKGSLYKVHHYWEDNRHVVIINESVCALDESNPFWHGEKPYDKCCYTPLPGEFYGIGIPEVLKDLQAELNTVRNQRIDFNSMALRRMWKMRKGCGLTAKDLVWRQNGIVQVEDLDDVVEIPVQPLPASAFSCENIVKQDMRDTTGVHDIIMGLAPSDETATTTMTKDNNASIRFEYFVKELVRDMIIPITKKCLVMDKQFLEEDRLIRVSGDENGLSHFIEVTTEDLLGDYDIVYVGTSIEPMANKELYKQKVMQAYNLAMGNPLIQNDPNAMIAWLRELAMAMEIKDVEGKMPTMPEVQQPPAADPFGNANSINPEEIMAQLAAGGVVEIPDAAV